MKHMKKKNIPGATIKKDPPTTVAQCADIALCEYGYWRGHDSDSSISGMGAAANIFAAITSGHYAPWHIKKKSSKS